MGVNLRSIIPANEIELESLSGKKIAIDAFNTVYQFLSIIRDRMTGEPLRDSKGNITSHLSGLFYRTTNLVEAGIDAVFVFDGEPPEFKQKTIEARAELKKEAQRKWEDALAKGEETMRYAQATAKYTEGMVNESKKLLDYMGIPWIQAPSEGEAACSYLCKKGAVFATGSQDSDSLLFGSPRLVRNLSISGRRKVPRKETYIEIKPEMINLDEVLSSLGITLEQLIILSILVGTDYAPGIKGVGPKTALKLVKEHKTLEKVLEETGWDYEVKAEEIYDFFLHPPINNSNEIEWKEPQSDKLMEFMAEEHDFSKERVQKVIEKLQQKFSAGKQSNLKTWFK
jgi:flap endonuclease-1